MLWQLAQATPRASWMLPFQCSRSPPRWQLRHTAFCGSAGYSSPNATATGTSSSAEWLALGPWHASQPCAANGVCASPLTPCGVRRMASVAGWSWHSVQAPGPPGVYSPPPLVRLREHFGKPTAAGKPIAIAAKQDRVASQVSESSTSVAPTRLRFFAVTIQTRPGRCIWDRSRTVVQCTVRRSRGKSPVVSHPVAADVVAPTARDDLD